jgi:hypothetical protein
MLQLLETLKDTVQSAVEQGATHVERIHQLVLEYAGQHAAGDAGVDRQSVYDLVRAINREVGELATDLFEIVEDAQRALTAGAKDDDDVSPGDASPS